MALSRPVLAILLFGSTTILAPACLAQLPVVTNATSTPIPGAGHDYLSGPAET